MYDVFSYLYLYGVCIRVMFKFSFMSFRSKGAETSAAGEDCDVDVASASSPGGLSSLTLTPLEETRYWSVSKFTTYFLLA